jgi:hypothetical protein
VRSAAVYPVHYVLDTLGWQFGFLHSDIFKRTHTKTVEKGVFLINIVSGTPQGQCHWSGADPNAQVPELVRRWTTERPKTKQTILNAKQKLTNNRKEQAKWLIQ